MLTIFRRRAIEIDCYVADSEGTPVTVDVSKVTASLVGPIAELAIKNITLEEHGHEDKPYYKMLVESEKMRRLEPGVYSMRLKIEDRKKRLNEIFALDTFPGNDNTGLPPGQMVVLNLYVKETATGGQWSGEVSTGSGVESVEVNGNVYLPIFGRVTLPDYPDELVDLQDSPLSRHVSDTEKGRWNGILPKIPADTSVDNPLVNKNYVDQNISRADAEFLGTNTHPEITEEQFLEWADALHPDANDYVFWKTYNEQGRLVYRRYKYNETQHRWIAEYDLNDSLFSPEQWAALDSGITSALLTQMLADIDSIAGGEMSLLARKLDNTPTGAHNRPIYIKPKDNDETHGEAAEVDGIDVPGDITSGRNIQAAGGVAAGGIANLNTNGMGGGGQGTVTAVGVDNNLVLEPVDGVIDFSIAITQGMSQYVPGRSYERGESFYVIGSSGRRTAYRVVANMTEFNYGCLEQLTLKAVSKPLNIGTSYIQGLN